MSYGQSPQAAGSGRESQRTYQVRRLLALEIEIIRGVLHGGEDGERRAPCGTVGVAHRCGLQVHEAGEMIRIDRMVAGDEVEIGR